MRFLRGRKNKSAKYSVKEGEIKFEAMNKKGDAKLCLMKIGLEESKEGEIRDILWLHLHFSRITFY